MVAVVARAGAVAAYVTLVTLVTLVALVASSGHAAQPALPAAGAAVQLADGVALAGGLEIEVVDAGGAPLEYVALALLPAAAGAAPERPAAPAAVIVQRDKTFIPLVTTVSTGTAVSFPNEDTVRHHVYSFSEARTFELKLYIGTPAKPVVFDRPGLVVLGCNIHDHMVAYVMVADTPWVASTAADGRARFEAVPDGDYALQYWYPGWADFSEPPRLPLRVGDVADVADVGEGVEGSGGADARPGRRVRVVVEARR